MIAGAGLVANGVEVPAVATAPLLPVRVRHAESLALFAAAGPTALAELRAGGVDRAHGGEAGRERGRRNAEHVRALAEWEHSGGGAEAGMGFARDVLPQLRGAPPGAPMRATGLAVRSCSPIRSGPKVPRPRQWAALARLGGPRER